MSCNQFQFLSRSHVYSSLVIPKFLTKLCIINKSASSSIWITTEIFLALSQIWTHRGRFMQLMKQGLYPKQPRIITIDLTVAVEFILDLLFALFFYAPYLRGPFYTCGSEALTTHLTVPKKRTINVSKTKNKKRERKKE